MGRRGDVPRHIQRTLEAIKKRGGRFSIQELGDSVASGGMIVTAVGTLYHAGFLKEDLKDKG